MDAQDEVALKQQAAERAVEFVESGMVIGLGTGSTAIWAVRRIGELLQNRQLNKIVGVPTSERTKAEAEKCGIPLSTLDEHPQLDITIDGADEVDPALNLIKGGGGALLREKIVAQASQRLIVVVDESKNVPRLGTNWALPIEVTTFAHQAQMRWIQAELGASTTLRRDDDDAPFVTDQGNYIVDACFGAISKPQTLSRLLNERAGIVEHGLFLEMATAVVVASKSGIRILPSNQ